MLIPGAEPFPWELSIFLKSLKEKFSDTKDLEICGAGGRWFKGDREILFKGSNTADDFFEKKFWFYFYK